MEITKNIQHLLFRTIDRQAPAAFADAEALRQLLMETAKERTPYLYDSVCQQIDMLIAEYCNP
jgi:hypothetical protein